MARPRKNKDSVITTKPLKIKKVKEPKVKKEISLLDQFITVSENEWAGIAENGIESGDITGHIDTGSYALNAMCSGSIYNGPPNNKIAVFAGEESVGKTYLLLSMIQTFLVDHPRGVVVIFETEGGLTKKMLVERGMDPKRIGVFPVETVQQWNNQALKVVNKYLEKNKVFRENNPTIFILDSLGMLSTEKEMEDIASGSGKKDMTRAALIKAAFRTLTLRLSRAGSALLVSNHTYEETGPFAKKVMSGGSGGKYAASTTIFLSKAQEKEGDLRVGNILTCILKKGRMTREGSAVKVSLRYDTGLNRYYGLIPIAVEYGIFKVGEKKKDDEKPIKKIKSATGAKDKGYGQLTLPDGIVVKESELNRNPEKYYTKEILDAIDEACKKKFMFGSSKELLEHDLDFDDTEESEEAE